MRAAALVIVCAAIGCRATPATPGYDLGVDLSAPTDDGGGGGDDLSSTDQATCPSGPEVCADGCDNDGNGYVDADDPACTTQLLVTLQLGSPSLWRLILEPTPHAVPLDGNPVTTGAMSEYNRLFSPAAYLAYDGSTKQIDRRVLGGATTSFNPAYSTRDVCVFNGELIVVDPNQKLHRFMSDGQTEIGVVTVAGYQLAACASDGNSLFVVRHTSTGPSEIQIFDKGGSGPTPSALAPIPIPDALANAGYVRIVDLAYVKKGGVFLALFSTALAADSTINGAAMAQIGFDGGGSAGPLIDGGVWHGIGEFLP